MAKNRNSDFAAGHDGAKGAESPIDHEKIAMDVIRSGQSPAQKMREITNHPTMPIAMKNWALDTITKIHGGAKAGILAAPGANTPENRPSVKGGEVKPISEEEAIAEQAQSKKQALRDAAKRGASVPQTSRPGRAKEPTNRTRGVIIPQKMPAKDVEHGLRALHVHLATISNSLEKHASTPEEVSSISEANGHLSNALTSLNKGASIGEGRKIEYLDKDGTPKSKFINQQHEANEHYIDAMGHIENAAKELSQDHVQRLATNANVSSEVPNLMLSQMRSNVDSLRVLKPSKDWEGVNYTETGDDGKPKSKFISAEELRNPKSDYSIKKIRKVGGKESTAVQKAEEVISPPPRVYKTKVMRGEASQVVGVEPSRDPRRRTSRTQRAITKFTGGKPTEGKTPTFEGSVGGKKLSSEEIQQIKATPWNPALKRDPEKAKAKAKEKREGGAV
jgi:hypothetical protein